VRDPEAVSEDRVSLDRFVTYRTVGSDQPTRGLLIHSGGPDVAARGVSMATPLGITWIGLSTGDRMPMIGGDTSEPPWVEIVAVGPWATGGTARRPRFADGNGSSLADPRQ
jgi:hypothetical protein